MCIRDSVHTYNYFFKSVVFKILLEISPFWCVSHFDSLTLGRSLGCFLFFPCALGVSPNISGGPRYKNVRSSILRANTDCRKTNQHEQYHNLGAQRIILQDMTGWDSNDTGYYWCLSWGAPTRQPVSRQPQMVWPKSATAVPLSDCTQVVRAPHRSCHHSHSFHFDQYFRCIHDMVEPNLCLRHNPNLRGFVPLSKIRCHANFEIKGTMNITMPSI